MPPLLSIIIVNYNTADLLIRCVESIQEQEYRPFEILVVDNASQDDSVAQLQSFPELTLIANQENVGFAKANNQALRLARGEYIHFLNPDTEVQPGTLATMVEFMTAHPQVGLAGSRLLFPDGAQQSSVEMRYPGARHAAQELAGLPGEIAWLLGASLIGRGEVIRALGGFDERFFLYGEDIDLCLAVRKQGWELGFIPEAVVIHWEGQSERGTLPIAVWQKKLAAELVFYKKHYRPATVQAIIRANRRQAWWRVTTITLLNWFGCQPERDAEKLARYKLTLQLFR